MLVQHVAPTVEIALNPGITNSVAQGPDGPEAFADGVMLCAILALHGAILIIEDHRGVPAQAGIVDVGVAHERGLCLWRDLHLAHLDVAVRRDVERG